MYSLEVGIENLLDIASQTTALPKLYFDSLNMIHCDLGISVLWQHLHRQYYVNIVVWVILSEGNHMPHCFHYEFYFHVDCLDYLVHDLNLTQTNQNYHNFGHCCCICHLSIVYDMVCI